MAIVIGVLVAIIAFALALHSEFARGMTTAPSMHASHFWTIFGSGLVLAALIIATHWVHIPHIGW